MPYYICPNCKKRSIDIDGVDGFSAENALQCRSCGFGFLFQLMDDYYPAPTTGFVVCDANARILATGRDVFQLSGFQEKDVLGRDLIETFQLGERRGRAPRPRGARVGRSEARSAARDPDALRPAEEGHRRLLPRLRRGRGLLVALTPRA